MTQSPLIQILHNRKNEHYEQIFHLPEKVKNQSFKDILK